jgi:hypothetical protein
MSRIAIQPLGLRDEFSASPECFQQAENTEDPGYDDRGTAKAGTNGTSKG